MTNCYSAAGASGCSPAPLPAAVALSGSRRTESAWIKTRVFDKAGAMVATMLLNMATLKDSYAPYEAEHRRLYGAGR